MLSDLNDYLPNDLSLIVIEYVKFSDKQLSIIMNQEIDPRSCYDLWYGHLRYLTQAEGENVLLTSDERLSIVFNFNDILLVKTKNFSQYIRITRAYRRCEQKKYSLHFHGSTIVVADDDKTFRVYDFDSDFT
jgi:hypothetical protein